MFDLTGLEIGDTIRISMTELGDGIGPIITDRDFTVASVAAPTVVKEPEAKPEGEEASTEGGDKDSVAADGDNKESDKS